MCRNLAQDSILINIMGTEHSVDGRAPNEPLTLLDQSSFLLPSTNLGLSQIFIKGNLLSTSYDNKRTQSIMSSGGMNSQFAVVSDDVDERQKKQIMAKLFSGS